MMKSYPISSTFHPEEHIVVRTDPVVTEKYFNEFSQIKSVIAAIDASRYKTKESAEKTMRTGVSYFEQFAWDLHHRGVSNIDIPVLILGIDA